MKTKDGHEIKDGMKLFFYAGMMEGMLQSKVVTVFKNPKKYQYSYICPHDGATKKARSDQIVFKSKRSADKFMAEMWN